MNSCSLSLPDCPDKKLDKTRLKISQPGFYEKKTDFTRFFFKFRQEISNFSVISNKIQANQKITRLAIINVSNLIELIIKNLFIFESLLMTFHTIFEIFWVSPRFLNLNFETRCPDFWKDCLNLPGPGKNLASLL